MRLTSVTLSLPIADRRASYAFYGAGLGLDAVGELADDGVPEPLQLELNDGVRLMLIPTGGFGWVTAGRDPAGPGQVECLISHDPGSPQGVDEFVERARVAGAEVVTEPGPQPWGYAATFADPDGHLWMITSAAAGA